jgi:hypothetical protein
VREKKNCGKKKTLLVRRLSLTLFWLIIPPPKKTHSRGMASGVWRPEAGAVEVVSKGKHTFQAIGFWARPPPGQPHGAVAAAAAAAAAAGEEEEEEAGEAAAAAAMAVAPPPAPSSSSSSTRRLYLHIEDALAMLDAGDLMLFAEEERPDAASHEGDDPKAAAKRRRRRPAAAAAAERPAPRPRLRLLSLQEAHRLSAGPLRVSAARLSLRAHLGRLGYAVGRFPARWALRAGEEPGAPWRGERGGGWAACDGRAGERAAAGAAGAAFPPPPPPSSSSACPKRRRRADTVVDELYGAPDDDDADPAARPSRRRRGWWPAVGDASHPWLPSGGGGQPPPRDLPASLAAPNWRYEAWLHASALAAGAEPPALPLPPRDAAPLPHPGRALAARFPLLRPLRALSDAELGLPSPPFSGAGPLPLSPPPPPLLPVLFDAHAASAAFSARDPGRPAFRVGLAPEGEAAAGWALPPLRDVAAGERASARASGEGSRPVPVRWAAVLAGGDVAFFSVETARLLDQQGGGGEAAGEAAAGAAAAAAAAGLAVPAGAGGG